MQHLEEIDELREMHKSNIMPIVSKIFCSSAQTVLVVRKRPHVVSGGGLVVSDCSQKVVFKVDGCGVLGTKGELILRGGDGEALLLIRRKEGIVEALSIYRQWKGYTFDYEGLQKLVFSLKELKSCLAMKNSIRITTVPRTCNKDWDFEIIGYFPDKACSIVDHIGNIIAQIFLEEEMMKSKDLYHVVVKPGIDQVFVFGIIAVLDYIYGESTIC